MKDRELCQARLVGRQAQAEVGQLRRVLLEQHVPRLDLAVQDVVGVEVARARTDTLEDCEQGREFPAQIPEPIFDGGVGRFHDAIPGACVAQPGVEERHEVRVLPGPRKSISRLKRSRRLGVFNSSRAYCSIPPPDCTTTHPRPWPPSPSRFPVGHQPARWGPLGWTGSQSFLDR